MGCGAGKYQTGRTVVVFLLADNHVQFFLHIFALEQQEGRLFKPLAYTKTFAMAGAALLSITLVPVVRSALHDDPHDRDRCW